MNLIFQIIPSIFHGGDDLDHALTHLSWKEMALGIGIFIVIFVLILLIALFAE